MNEATELTLKDYLRDLILTAGPISVSEYMSLALAHPTLGYYRSRDPLGRGGDFTTAPEISQMFGELLGLWAVMTWQRFGEPTVFNLVEVGPGRGTLMADALRATKNVPGFHAALHVHMVETSTVLIDKQLQTLKAEHVPITWHTDVTQIPETGPVCMIGNEFLDALPLRQVIFTEDQWHERLVTWDTPQQALTFAISDMPLSPQPEVPSGLSGDALTEGAILEIPHVVTNVLADVAQLLQASGGVALFIDYGHSQSGIGDTLQAMQGHQYADILADPGNADLTVHVDFAHVARRAQIEGLKAYGPTTQGHFLAALGLGARAQQLVQAAQTDQQRRDIALAYDRLVGADGMGSLFKVIALTTDGFGAPEGFQ